jgi:hypothetical protein
MTIVTADAARRTQSISAFSFDVFDTFLVRACTTPEVAESFLQHRILAEARARKTAKDSRGSCA